MTQTDEQNNPMDIDRVCQRRSETKFIEIICFLVQGTEESTEVEEESSNIADSSASDDEDDSICSIVMSTSENDHGHQSDSNSIDASNLMKNYALMLEVPTALTTNNDIQL